MPREPLRSRPSRYDARSPAWPQFADIVPDYILGNGTAALYISVRYHLLHPEYLYFRIRELQRRRVRRCCFRVSSLCSLVFY
jgi:DNA repair protein Rad10